MNGFTYTLILEEPVLANSLSGDTNSARSLPFIPGGLVRGALVNYYTGEKEAGDENFRRLFLNGETRFLHAYPVGIVKRENQEPIIRRMLPAPTAWKEYKDQPTLGIENFAATIQPDEKLKDASFPFYILNGDTVVTAKHEWQINVHTQRDAVYGRAKEGQGAVFRYEALPAGLHLEGMILAEDKKDADKIKEILPEYIMLGKARTAGYGRARLVIGNEIDDRWREDDSSPLTRDKENKFIITLLSDVILRDANGQVTLDPLAALQAKLNVNDLKVNYTFHKMGIVGGFNRAWGLPLPQSQALGAGSVFVVESASGVRKEALAELERSGLGERKAEGFGRVAVSVNPKEHLDLDSKNGKLKFEMKAPASLLPAEIPVADLILKRLLRRELDEKVMSTVITAVNEYDPKKGVKNSQLSRWRVNLRSAIHAQKGVGAIHKFYKEEDSRNSPSWQKMTRARVKISDAPVRLTEWMKNLLEKPESVWGMIGYTDAPEKKIGARPLSAKTMDAEYSLRLMDAVFASLYKKNTEGGNDGK